MSIFQVEEVIEIRGVRFRLKNRALFVLIQNGTIFRQKRPSSLPSNNFLSPSDMGNLSSLLTEIQLHILLYVAGGDIWREHGMRAHFECSKDLLSLALCSKDLSVSFAPFSIYVSRTQSDQPLLCILFQPSLSPSSTESSSSTPRSPFVVSSTSSARIPPSYSTSEPSSTFPQGSTSIKKKMVSG